MVGVPPLYVRPRYLAHDREHSTGQPQGRTDPYGDAAVDHRLADALRRTSGDGMRDDHAPRLVTDHVDVGVSRVDSTHHVSEDRDWRDRMHPGVLHDAFFQGGPDRRVRRERAGHLRGHQPLVGSEEVDRAVSLAQETVVQCAEQSCHGEHERSRRQPEHHPSGPPLHVAQRDQDHGPTSRPTSRMGVGPAVFPGDCRWCP